jgi:hypothetical protein
MKRALVVLLALVMGAGLLFAADQAPAKWGAYLEGYYYFWNQDGQVALADQYTAFTLSYSEPVFGFTATMEPAAGDFFVAWRNVQGWYSLFDGMLKVTVGKDRISDYRSTTYEDGGNAYTRWANAEWGLALQVVPVKNLSVGAFVKFPQVLTAQDYVDMLAFGASYAIPDMATINVVFRTMDSAITAPVVDTKENELGVGVTINAIKGLPISLGYGLSLYAASDPRSNILLSTKYTMDALTLLFDANVTLWTANANDFGYAADLVASYALSKAWTAGVQLEYGNQSYADMTGGGFFVWPWIQANIGSAHTLRLGFQLDTDGDGAGADTLLWSIPLFYTMSF